VLTANVGLPHRSTHEAIALAIHLIVHVARVAGQRRVTQVLTVREYDGQADRFHLDPYAPNAPVHQGALV
jgi:Flp pilus assembly CpaF family ATPase